MGVSGGPKEELPNPVRGVLIGFLEVSFEFS